MQRSFQRNPAVICLEGTTLFEGKALLTKIESAASFESYTMIWKYVTILSITPFLCKYVTLLSKNSSCALLGQEHHLFEGTVSFSKNIILHPQRLHTWKGKLHIPKEYCACLAYFFFRIMTWQECLGGKMNQIWFGLIWINPKESKTQRNQRKQKKTIFSRLAWTCLVP